jgi:hypothetical protein
MLLDEAHARLVLRRAAMLRDDGWTVAIKSTYSIYGERGAIDVFAARSAEQAVTVEEVKTDLTSLEQLGRKTDEKVRLVRARLCRERFGFDPVPSLGFLCCQIPQWLVGRSSGSLPGWMPCSPHALGRCSDGCGGRSATSPACCLSQI